MNEPSDSCERSATIELEKGPSFSFQELIANLILDSSFDYITVLQDQGLLGVSRASDPQKSNLNLSGIPQ